MIFGECPYCEKSFSTNCATITPAFSIERCNSCDKEYWLKHSKIDPIAYQKEEFLKYYKIDESSKTVELKKVGLV